VLVNRTVVLYLATLTVTAPIDFLFLGILDKWLLHLAGRRHAGRDQAGAGDPVLSALCDECLILVSGPAAATWESTLLYGALFGLFCYATFELASLALLKHWTWPVVVVDMGWGAFVTAVSSSTAGLFIANWLAPKV
jgi:Predicted membrane protein (DUF2177)